MKKILIVDDSKTIVKTLKHKLELELDVEVYTAYSMKESADLILKEKGKFDLALLDYNLPDATQGQIVTFINKFSIPSILLTGSEFSKDNEVFSNPNLIDYVIKKSGYAINYTVSVIKRFIKNESIEVMVLDDSKTFCTKMAMLCQKYNLKTIIETDPLHALETLNSRSRLKLILVDYMMPGMNGLEFTAQVRKEYPKDELSIIALSGTSDKEIVSSFLKYGANDFLYKDFSADEFLARVNNNLEVMELFETTQDRSKRDNLTGTFNENYFYKTARPLYQTAKKRKDLFSIACIEIDNFDSFTESKGHEISDEAIKHVANILQNNFNKDSMIARISVDQFCVALQNRSYAEIHQTFQEIQKQIQSTPIKYENDSYTVTISIGVNYEFCEDLEQMIHYADEALCNTQTKGINQIAKASFL